MSTRVRGSASLKVLFIGNSFTARNDLPRLAAQLAAARGKAIQHRLISAGGASLRQHWNHGEALQAIQEGHYDHVVLQEQSTLSQQLDDYRRALQRAPFSAPGRPEATPSLTESDGRPRQ